MEDAEYLNLEFFRMPESVPQADRGRLVVDAEDDDEKKKKSRLLDRGSNGIEKSGFAKFLKNLKL